MPDEVVSRFEVPRNGNSPLIGATIPVLEDFLVPHAFFQGSFDQAGLPDLEPFTFSCIEGGTRLPAIGQPDEHRADRMEPEIVHGGEVVTCRDGDGAWGWCARIVTRK